MLAVLLSSLAQGHDPNKAFAVLDRHGRIVDCNIAIVRITGRLRSEVQGTRFVDLIDPHDRAKAATRISADDARVVTVAGLHQ